MAKTSLDTSKNYFDRVDENFLKEEYLEATSGVVGAGQFYSEIVNRAPLIDLSQDLGVRMGVNRTQTQRVVKLEDEVGPSGEAVYGVTNDKFDQIRFVGGWTNTNSSSGAYPNAADNSSDYVEITFYGTGLNVMTIMNVGNRSMTAQVDGGAAGADLIAVASGVLDGRNYASNQIVAVSSGLALGVHTIKINNTGVDGIDIFGIEILNESTDMVVPKGAYFVDGREVSHPAEENLSYNSDFRNEYGTPGTKGGCVSVYMNQGGEALKDVQWADVTPQYMGSTDHSNEEVTTKHNFREFGAGRVDDFSTIVGSVSDRAFTLDDGTTTLMLNNGTAFIDGATGIDTCAIDPNGAGNFLTITFVGTGLDITASRPDTGTSTYKILVDGVDVSGTLQAGQIGGNGNVVKICSGLPYGTHTVKIESVATVSASFGVSDFIVYGPKKPVVESDSQEIGYYYLMADFVQNNTSAIDKMSKGTAFKHCAREVVYTGTWNITSIDTTKMGGFGVNTSTNNSYLEYTFFGTGFKRRGLAHGVSTTEEVSLNGDLITAANFPTAVVDVHAEFTYNSGAGTFLNVGSSNGSGYSVQGLPLALHTVRITKLAGDTLYFDGLEITTPTHSPKLNGSFQVQNTLRVGSQGIGDSRELVKKEKGGTVICEGVISQPTTNSTTIIPIGDMHSSIYMEEAGEVDIEIFVNIGNVTEGQESFVEFTVDGRELGFGPNGKSWQERSPLNNWMLLRYTKRVHLSKGFHFIMVGYGSNGNTAFCRSTARELTIRKV